MYKIITSVDEDSIPHPPPEKDLVQPGLSSVRYRVFPSADFSAVCDSSTTGSHASDTEYLLQEALGQRTQLQNKVDRLEVLVRRCTQAIDRLQTENKDRRRKEQTYRSAYLQAQTQLNHLLSNCEQFLAKQTADGGVNSMLDILRSNCCLGPTPTLDRVHFSKIEHIQEHLNSCDRKNINYCALEAEVNELIRNPLHPLDHLKVLILKRQILEEQGLPTDSVDDEISQALDRILDENAFIRTRDYVSRQSEERPGTEPTGQRLAYTIDLDQQQCGPAVRMDSVTNSHSF